MDANETTTWTTGGSKKKYRNDYFFPKNSTAESSDSCALFNDEPAVTKSQAALILEAVEKQLKMDETEYKYMEDRFRYIQRLYVGPETIPSQIVDSKTADEALMNELSCSRDDEPISPINGDDDKVSDYNVASGETRYGDFYSETQQIIDRRQEEADDNSSDSDHQNYFSEEANALNNIFAEEEMSKKDEDMQIRREFESSDISSNPHPYQRHLAEYSKSIHEEMEEMEEDTRAEEISEYQEKEEICFIDRSQSPKNDLFKSDELLHQISIGNAQSVRTFKNKKSRAEKRRKVSATSTAKKNLPRQVDDTLCGTSKYRRKRRKVRATNSKSTTATRDTFLHVENKKETRNTKPRGQPTMQTSKLSQNRQENVPKVQQNRSEVVEIYHNNAITNESLSVVSSKHLKLEPQGRNVPPSFNTHDQRCETRNFKLTEKPDQFKCNLNETQTRRALNSQIKNQSTDNNEEIRPKIYQQGKQEATDFRSGEPNGAKIIHKVECPVMESEKKIPGECNEHQSSYYDSLTTRNYELPTVASKMKRVNRSYFNRFNFRNIPFVVGTSVTPSYNLGLNIQETFSLIKTRNMMPGGVTPLLMSKLRKGVEPVSTLLGCAGDRNTEIPIEGSTLDVTSVGMPNPYPDQMTSRDIRTPKISCVHTNRPSFEAHHKSTKIIDVTSTKKPKTQSNCSVPKKNNEDRLQLTQSTLLKQRQEELNIADAQQTNYKSVTQNMNGIREVLSNFHDQFEAMNYKYEKLHDQLKKSNDESLKEEIATLEKELSAKEEEINAVVNLYKEVMTLKQQMRLLHEKNSLVCVVTETPETSMYHQMGSRIQGANPMFSLYRRNGLENSNRGPSTSTRLAGMLRQIKVFQMQLKSAT